MPSLVSQPWSVQIELTEGCNRLCGFCGLNAIRDSAGGPYRHLTVELTLKLARELAALCPEARYEFAMHGEPLQNPAHLAILQTFRAYLPRAQMQVTTNGKVLMGRMQAGLDRLFAAGVDFIILDTYRPERDDLRAEARTLTGIRVRDFYDDCAPAGWSPWHNHRRKEQRLVVLMDDLGERTGEVASRTMLNHAGCNPLVPPLAAPLNKTCTNPFRELTVTWNGRVNICCMDWRHEYVAGSAETRTLSEIWYGPELEAARAMLQAKDRGFGPCAKCDAGSGSRSGLLPKYPAPTAEQRALVAQLSGAKNEKLVKLRR